MNSKLVVFALLVASSIGLHPANAEDVAVTIKNFDYAPMELNITTGTTVVWKNLDGEPHTIASTDGLFRSPALDQNDSFRFTFATPGVYKYICSIHPKMKATITVH
ncbi:MAG TPA: cupredoxin family copper-binding protein [Rhizomicrobium sp.]|jgi:plastocyanin|nr:cupredoxin family copper-binding protein [Rhizomicrobium sp.]